MTSPIYGIHETGGVQLLYFWSPQLIDWMSPTGRGDVSIFYLSANKADMDAGVLGGDHGEELGKGVGSAQWERLHPDPGFLLEELHADGRGNIVLQPATVKEDELLDPLGGFFPSFGQYVLVRQEPFGHGFRFVPIDVLICFFLLRWGGKSECQHSSDSQTES